jgi:phosphoglycolate phosphatase
MRSVGVTATYVFWDIDGTLIRTGGAGLRAWEQAIAEVLGRSEGLAEIDTSGVTDAEIAVAACRAAGADQAGADQAGADQAGADQAGAARRLLRALERLLPAELRASGGRVLPNVRENLEALSARDDVVNMLLTGNLAATGRFKLELFDLWRFFDAGAAFSVEGADRAGVARHARALAERHAGRALSSDAMVVIGDTPHDIACGKAIGARTVAVATGRVYTLAELERAEPWRALPALPEPGRLCALLGLDPCAPDGASDGHGGMTT